MKMLCSLIPDNQSGLQKFVSRISPCSCHKRVCQFICLQKSCQSNQLLCSQCISAHNSHKFQSIQKFFTQQKLQILTNGSSNKSKHFQQLKLFVQNKLTSFKRIVQDSIANVNQALNVMIHQVMKNGPQYMQTNSTLSNKDVLNIRYYLDTQWTYLKFDQMKSTYSTVFNKVFQSFTNLASDLKNFIKEQDWDTTDQSQYKTIQQRYFKHLHFHQKKVTDYFKFSREQKASSITLKQQNFIALYSRDSPSLPFILCSSLLTAQQSQCIFQIVECDSRLLIFNASTIFIGICNYITAKKMSYQKMNQGGRGSYLIGSNGWSYHHLNPLLDRQDIVGFTFGKGDKIKVKVDFQKAIVRFTKLGKIYDNKFQMRLGIDQKQIKLLKPCIGFCQEVGVSVKVYNL